jgi:hypothetical protein
MAFPSGGLFRQRYNIGVHASKGLEGGVAVPVEDENAARYARYNIAQLASSPSADVKARN